MNNRRNIGNNSRNTSDNKESSNNNGYGSTPSDRFYTLKEEIILRFYQTPKALFNNPKYKGLSLGPKLMYSILRDRLDISIKNNWKDEKGYIYLIFSIEDLSDLLEIDRKAVMRYKKLLVDYGLIIDKRLGQGRSNRIYVLKPELRDNQKSQKGTSRSPDKVPLEVPNKDTNDTNLNDPNLNNVNRASREEAVENSGEEVKGEKSESKEDINDIRKKIRKSLGKNNEESILRVNNSGENSNQENNYSGKGEPDKYFPKKRRSAEKELLAKEITEELDDDHSMGAFCTIGDKIPEQQIRIFFSIIKDTHLTGKIKRNKGAMFISLARAYAKKNNINLNFK